MPQRFIASNGRPQPCRLQQPALNGVRPLFRRQRQRPCLQGGDGHTIGQLAEGRAVLTVAQALHDGGIQHLLRLFFRQLAAEGFDLLPEAGIPGSIQQRRQLLLRGGLGVTARRQQPPKVRRGLARGQGFQ